MDRVIEDILSHHGVKGQKWGVTRAKSSSEGTPKSSTNRTPIIRKDGSMDIPPGVNIQRLVRSSGKSLPMNEITYASIHAYDNARYIKIIGGKGFFGGGRDAILTIKTTKRIKAPSVDEATKIVSDMMVHDTKFRQKNTDILGNKISDKELKKIAAEPTGKTAQAWYFNTNQKLTFDKEFDQDAPYVQRVVREKMQEKGYNALRDENDVSSGIAKAPIIIFNPKDSLRVVDMTHITDEIRSANKAKLKEYKKQGNDWIEKQLYTNPEGN